MLTGRNVALMMYAFFSKIIHVRGHISKRSLEKGFFQVSPEDTDHFKVISDARENIENLWFLECRVFPKRSVAIISNSSELEGHHTHMDQKAKKYAIWRIKTIFVKHVYWVALKEQQKLISRIITTTEVTDEKESKNEFFCRSQRGVTTWKDMQNMSLKGGVNQWAGARQCFSWQKRPCMDDHKPSPEDIDSIGEMHLFVHRMYQHACTWPTLMDRI